MFDKFENYNDTQLKKISDLLLLRKLNQKQYGHFLLQSIPWIFAKDFNPFKLNWDAMSAWCNKIYGIWRKHLNSSEKRYICHFHYVMVITKI